MIQSISFYSKSETQIRVDKELDSLSKRMEPGSENVEFVFETVQKGISIDEKADRLSLFVGGD